MARKATTTKEPAKAKTAPAAEASTRTRAGAAAKAPAAKAAAAKGPAAKGSAAKAPAAKAATRAGAKPTAKSAARQQTKTPVKAAAPSTVTLKHLAVGITERHGLPKKQADAVLAEVFAQLVDHLKAGERVRIGGLGIIQVKDRPARMGRNPATGEAIQIKASRKIAFRAAKELKDAI